MKCEELLFRAPTLTLTNINARGHPGIQSCSFLWTGTSLSPWLGLKHGHAAKYLWKASARRPRNVQLTSRAHSAPTRCSDLSGGSAASLRESARPCSPNCERRRRVRALAHAELLETGDDGATLEEEVGEPLLETGDDADSLEEGGGEPPPQADMAALSPPARRVLQTLIKYFGGEQPTVVAARVVESLLTLQLTETDVESIFLRHRPLYNASFVTKRRHDSNLEEMTACLLSYGFAPKEVGKIIKTKPTLLTRKQYRDMALIIEYLRDELQVARVPRAVTLWPGILTRRVPKVRAVAKFLKEEAGMRSVAQAVELSPALLGADIDNLREKTAALRAIYGKHDLGLCLARCPDLLFVGLTVPAAAHKWLKATLGPEAAARVIEANPQVLAGRADVYAVRLEALRETLRGIEVIPLLVRRPRILSANPETVRRTFEWLVETFGEAGAVDMVERSPQLVHSTAERLRTKLDFVIGEMGRSRLDLLESPLTLSLALESRLRPRYAAVRAIGLAHHFALGTLFDRNDKPKYDVHRRFDHPDDMPPRSLLLVAKMSPAVVPPPSLSFSVHSATWRDVQLPSMATAGPVAAALALRLPQAGGLVRSSPGGILETDKASWHNSRFSLTGALGAIGETIASPEIGWGLL
eukprot:jgi/Mesen1/7503/ME000039S06722